MKADSEKLPGLQDALPLTDWRLRCALGLAFGPEPSRVSPEPKDHTVSADQAWAGVVDVLDRLRLTPWVWSRLSMRDSDDPARAHLGHIPSGAVARLSQIHLGTFARNMVLLEALDEILAKATGRALPVMPIKGAALLGPPFLVYSDLGARPMVDLDLFCPMGRLDEFSALMEELGYEITQSALDRVGLGHHRYYTRRASRGQGQDVGIGAGGGGQATAPSGLGGSVTVEIHYRLSVWWWGLGALDREFASALVSDLGFSPTPSSRRCRPPAGSPDPLGPGQPSGRMSRAAAGEGTEPAGRAQVGGVASKAAWGAASQPTTQTPRTGGPAPQNTGDRGRRIALPTGRGWPERHIIGLCLHFLKHGFGPDLRNVVDIMELTRSHHIDWALLAEIATDAGVWPTIAFILHWIQETILDPVEVRAPWTDALGSPSPSQGPAVQGRFLTGLPGPLEGLSRVLAARIPRDRIPPRLRIPDLPPTLRRHFDALLDATGNNIFLEIALLPGLLPKTAAATWWLWDRWNLRRFLPKPRK